MGSQTMAQMQAEGAWTAKYSPPQYGRKRNPDLMVTGPTLRGGGGTGNRPSSAAAGGYAPRAADDATTYVSSHTSYYR